MAAGSALGIPFLFLADPIEPTGHYKLTGGISGDMGANDTWHEDEGFWRQLEPFLFPPEVLNKASEQIEKLLSLLEIDRESHVLDLACGVGRHSIELSKRGFRVTGLDATRPYLETAKERACAEAVEVEFIHDDMRKFNRPGMFDAVFNLYTSFGYFERAEDDERVVRNCHESLKPGGVLVLSLVGKEELARDFEKRTWDERDGTFFLEEHQVTDQWSWVENRWILVNDGQVDEYEVSHRLYSAAELSDLLRRAGFSEVDIYGDLDGDDYDQNAEKLVAIARR